MILFRSCKKSLHIKHITIPVQNKAKSFINTLERKESLVSHNGSSCRMTLAHKNEVVRQNPTLVEVLTVSLLIGKMMHQRYDSKIKYKLVK